MECLVLCCASLLLFLHVHAVSQWTVSDLDEAFFKLEEALDFTNRNYKNLTVDLNCSPKQVAGQLGVLRRRIEEGSLTATQRHYNNIRYLRYYAELVASKGAPYTLITSSNQFLDIQLLTSDYWYNIDYKSRDVDVSYLETVKYRGLKYSTIDVTCLNDIFGDGNNTKPCNFSDTCLNYLYASGLLSYDATHQIFNLLNAEANGCFVEPTEKQRYAMSEYVCSNIILENFHEYLYEEKPLVYMDITWERIAFCGMMGFHQFARRDWFKEGMQYRRPYGCWNTREKTSYNETTGELLPASHHDMEGGCESHPTAVAMVALTQFIRYILEEFTEIPSLYF